MPTGSKEECREEAGDGAARAAGRRTRWANVAMWSLMISACIFYAARLLWIVQTYAVNILFRDQWGFYPPVYARGWWQAFSHQHGPHRQGLGNLVSKVLLPITHANIRAEALIIAILIIAAAVLAIVLRKRVTGRVRWYDGFLVLLLLTPAQYALFARVPNPSHGAWPLILVITMAMAVLMRPGWMKIAVLAGLMFVSVYTGFAVLLGVAVPAVLGLGIVRAMAKRDYRTSTFELLALIACGISAATFLINYRPETSSPAPLGGVSWYTYPNLMAYQFSRLAGFADATPVGCAVGWAIMGLCVAVLLWHLLKFARRQDPPAVSIVIILMMTYVLVYSFSSAFGRSTFGAWIMVSSRYLPLMAPAAIAVFLHVAELKGCWLRYAAIGLFGATTIWATAWMRSSDVKDMVQLCEGKKRWLAVYMQTNDIYEAQRVSGFELYPRLEDLRNGWALDEMKKRNLGPFRGEVKAALPVDARQ